MQEIKTYPQIIADRMAWIRIELCNMTQTEFAKAIGVANQHTISEYETGYLRPGLNRCAAVMELAAKYGKEITIGWLRPDIIKE